MSAEFVFPADDRDLMQLLEVRGNNGGVPTVETVYCLTGSTYYVPEQLFPCDDPDLYYAATADHFEADLPRIAQRIAAFYEDRAGPRMVMFVHTHPDGNPQPSQLDKQSVVGWKQLFDGYFDDYRFFTGLHGLCEAGETGPEWMRRPEQTGENEVSWWGARRKHRLAVFDGEFEPRPVAVTTAAEWQQRHGGSGRPHPGIWSEVRDD